MSFQGERHTSNLRSAPRNVRACVSCHSRKVRCDLSHSKLQCSRCQRDGLRCEPRLRQRRSNNNTKTAPIWKTSDAAKSDSRSLSLADPSSFSYASPQDESRRDSSQSEWTASFSTRRTDEQPSVISNSNDVGFMERSSYIAPDSFRGEDCARVSYHVQVSSEVDSKILDLQQALHLPPRAVAESLFENFWTYCYPWDPIVEKSQITGMPLENISPFLLQAIFLAGSRMSSLSASYTTPQKFYKRAKTLFYLNCETNPLTLIVAVSLLHWYNPTGPERVSTDTATFWSKVSVSIAQQMGLHKRKKHTQDESLRRRIWWSIVARDSLISLAHGRPQAINLDECDVPRLSLDDFPNSPPTGPVFIAYVELSLILGRFRKHALSRTPSNQHITDIQDSLYHWVKTLPDTISMSPPSMTYNFECRQLHVLYFVTLTLLYRSRALEDPFPVAAVVASSTIAGIFEELLARDAVRFLGLMFTFHLLAAAIALLSCYKYPDLWIFAQEDLKIIRNAQEELSKKWPSALGSIKSFERMHELTLTTQKETHGLQDTKLPSEQAVFFDNIDISLCRMWEPLQSTGAITKPFDPCTAGKSAVIQHQDADDPQMLGSGSSNGVVEHPVRDDMFFEPPNLDDDLYGTSQLTGPIGDWLFWDQMPSSFS